ncbi:DsbA family protein [Rhodobacter sp. NTK016B]|uniref:2-hydroxychromene-2-carboxylate isomerase n=1 Tax=Rhodobacter sp. NTK016B TaxID=2759676 RepID=UPI001A8F092C|nr:DsbA family protein [Rhodobacter sp. NTK016B]MBN8294817.1 DsbA family protein [Rhodobacter sp. NTK016B]
MSLPFSVPSAETRPEPRQPETGKPEPRKVVHHFYSLASPWAYLGAQRLVDLADFTGAEILSYPVSTFKDNGWVPLVEKPANRQAYVFVDLKRWAKRFAIPMVIDGRPAGMAGLADALPMVWAAQLQGHDALALSMVLQKAYWEECRDVGQRAVRVEVADAAGYDGAALAVMEDSTAVAEQKEAMFAAARAAGVFGSPTYICDGEMYWGQDRLDFLAHALQEGGTA